MWCSICGIFCFGRVYSQAGIVKLFFNNVGGFGGKVCGDADVEVVEVRVNDGIRVDVLLLVGMAESS